MTSLRIKDTRDLCEFLSTNVVERERRREGHDAGWKEGYLTKRGKNFGGWKTRYFVLRGPILEYFDMVRNNDFVIDWMKSRTAVFKLVTKLSPMLYVLIEQKDGHHLGSIALTSAQIGRQQSQEKNQDASNEGKEGSTDPNSYRHAFLILEPKKGQTVVDAKKNPNNVLRHVLCAETDDERDAWVDALMLYVGKEPNEGEGDKEKSGRKIPEIQKLGATPIKELASNKGNEKLLLNQDAYERQQRSIPTSGSPQQIQGSRGGAPQSPSDDRQSSERQSADGQYPPGSRGNLKNGDTSQYPSQQAYHNQQPQLPRNPSSQSLPQDDVSIFFHRGYYVNSVVVLLLTN